ncbi:peptide deformylase [Clostridiaceae bacterium UIB06]|uniref:Peptide deformylase n=1 Tax=Clostridium thailandense TaxID=2794346 RepID=A0A949WV37_9CLOT|nr:peptide deformylase [Clostridium thailandense]MBV7273247.1 peptide deformylase [Clostridium thailandense]MCH5137956.1 peptide deformylase [Clostridiaceae bacterium UIB06]
MAIKDILKFGDKTLTRVSRRVEKIDEEVLSLIQDLKDTLYNTDGVGLAAPQIGVLKRVILIDLRDGSEPIILINPKITKKIGRVEDIEGCLSYPGYEGEVVRPRRVIVLGITLEGNEVEYTAEGFLARAFCHEIDHLDGIIYTDRCKKVYKIEEE